MSEQTKSKQAPEGSMETLVFTKSRDGLPLEGVVIAPEGSQGAELAVVWIHGGASKFYERHYATIGRELAIRGYPS